MVRSTWSGPCGLSSTRMAVTHTGGRPLEGESWWMVGPAGGRSGATTNVQTSTKLYRGQQAPPMRRYLNDGATRTLAAPTIVDTRVDPTKLQISRESNMLGSTLPSREPVKRRTSRIHTTSPMTPCNRIRTDIQPTTDYVPWSGEPPLTVRDTHSLLYQYSRFSIANGFRNGQTHLR